GARTPTASPPGARPAGPCRSGPAPARPPSRPSAASGPPADAGSVGVASAAPPLGVGHTYVHLETGANAPGRIPPPSPMHGPRTRMGQGGCGGSGGLVGMGGGGVGAGAGAAAGAAAGAEPLDADDAGALRGPSPAPAGAGEPALPPGRGAVAEVAGPTGASVTDATGTRVARGPRVGTRGRAPSRARTARPACSSGAASFDTGPDSMTTTNAADDPSAHSVAILLLRDRARMRRVRRLRPDRRLDLAAVLGLVGSSSSQKVVLRSQNESSIRIPPIAVSPSDIDRTKRRAPRSRDQR